MSHVTGKIEVAGLTREHVIFRYHQAANPERVSRVIVFERQPDAHWFDDYPEAVAFRPALVPA